MLIINILWEYLLNINFFKIVYITEKSPVISEIVDDKILEFLKKNYLFSKWEYILTNKKDFWYLKEFKYIILNIDDFNTYKYILKHIFIYIESIIIYLECIYIDLILPNKYLNIIIWYLNRDDLLNKNYKINIYYNNLLELLKEIDEGDSYIHNLHKKKLKLLKINNIVLGKEFYKSIVKNVYDNKIAWPKKWTDIRGYGANHMDLAIFLDKDILMGAAIDSVKKVKKDALAYGGNDMRKLKITYACVQQLKKLVPVIEHKYYSLSWDKNLIFLQKNILNFYKKKIIILKLKIIVYLILG